MMKSMMKVAGLSLSLALVACGGISSEKPADAPKVLAAKAAKPALVRFVNAAEGVASAQFAVGDKAVEANLVPGAFMTSRAEVPSGDQTLKVLGGGTAAIFESKLNLTAEGSYTVVLLGNASGPGLSGRLDAIVLEDGCAAFTPEVHRTAIDALRPVGRVATVAEMLAEVNAA